MDGRKENEVETMTYCLIRFVADNKTNAGICDSYERYALCARCGWNITSMENMYCQTGYERTSNGGTQSRQIVAPSYQHMTCYRQMRRQKQ